MHTLLSWILPFYLVAYGLATVAWPIYRTWKHTGINPYALGNTDNVHDLIGRILWLVMVGCTAVAGVYIFWPDGYHHLAPIDWLQHPGVTYLGLAILGLALAWTVAAQYSLGRSWRIGIDHEHRTDLMSAGIYRYSRNPIFLGMRATAWGFFFALPNAPTLAILAVGEAAVHIQVRLEEEFLRGVHGAAYEEYCRQTRRWL